MMRSTYAFTATCYDLFVDPFATWTLHVFLSIRKEVLQGSTVAVKDLEKAREILKSSNGGLPATRSGRHNVIAYLGTEMDMEICDEDPTILKRKDDTPLQIKLFSHRFFKEELARPVRRYLVKKIPIRHDFSEHTREHIDIHRTRLLLDTSFQTDEEWSFLRPYFDRLPKNALTAAILRALLQGSVYTNRRRHAAVCIAEAGKATHTFFRSPFMNLLGLAGNIRRFVGTRGFYLNLAERERFASAILPRSLSHKRHLNR